jgi:hypothetical protein
VSCPLGVLEGCAARLGERHEVTAPIARIALPGGEAQRLELVQQQHAVVRVQVHPFAERLLRGRLVLAQVGEGHQVLEPDSEQSLIVTRSYRAWMVSDER